MPQGLYSLLHIREQRLLLRSSLVQLLELSAEHSVFVLEAHHLAFALRWLWTRRRPPASTQNVYGTLMLRHRAHWGVQAAPDALLVGSDAMSRPSDSGSGRSRHSTERTQPCARSDCSSSASIVATSAAGSSLYTTVFSMCTVGLPWTRS